MSCKVGNQTNSQDPQAVNSRVFVGNLNTFQCSKTDVERRFQRYGRIAGISMHKGYAFIQFTNPFDARSACLGEDARLLWGQTLDVNLVAEPKPHQTGRKRQNIAKTGNDWDYYYDSYYAQLGFPTPRPILPPMKRPRIHLPPNPPQQRSIPNKPHSPNNKTHQAHVSNNNTSFSDLKSYSTPDILICGNCREMFSEVEQLMEHKKTYCKLRFTCKCHMLNGSKAKSPGEEPASLLCSQCKDSFESAWDLMVHVQSAHMLNIYTLGADNNKDSEDIKEEDGVVCGNNSGPMDDSGDHHNSHQLQSPNSALMSLGPSTSTSGGSTTTVPHHPTSLSLASYPTQNGLSCFKHENNSMGTTVAGLGTSSLHQPSGQQSFSTTTLRQTCTSSLLFPMEASTQTTTTDHSSTTNNSVADSQHCSILSTKTEPSLLLTVANGQA